MTPYFVEISYQDKISKLWYDLIHDCIEQNLDIENVLKQYQGYIKGGKIYFPNEEQLVAFRLAWTNAHG